ncbi:uncharacterized protein LOC143918886 isoform X2 [Arctopsyche grandis]|uniref:uncharacterized protein LOC143918886 isoform X2 n=1 Tax=Arctopsyche grandis TaxID=121162 RepID=UPI00406D8D80
MECRLCLYSVPVESSVSIFDDAHPLVQRIWTCCRLQIEKGNGLPDKICLSCVNNLEMISSFRNACLESVKTSKQIR